MHKLFTQSNSAIESF